MSRHATCRHVVAPDGRRAASEREPVARSARRRWIVGLVLLAAIAGGSRAIHLFEVRDSPRWQVHIGDAGRYHAWAAEIAAGDWLGEGTFYQAPLYPYCLAAVYAVTGPDPVAARWVQAFLGVLSCVLLAMAGRRLFGAQAGWWAGLLLALWPAELFHESLLEKSGLTTFLMCAWLLSISITLRSPLTWGGWFANGVLLGSLGLVRENVLLLAVLMTPWIAFHPRRSAHNDRFSVRRRSVAIVCMLLGCITALLPVLVRNRFVGGDWRLTTAQFGPNFFIGNSRDADGMYRELVAEHGTPTHEQRDATVLAERAVGRSLTPGEVSAWWTQRTIDEIREVPGRWLRLILQKVALTWTSVEIADSEDQYTAASESSLLGFLTQLLPFGLLVGAAACGICWLFPRLQRVWIVPAILVAYTASIALFYLFARYRLPLVPPMTLLAGAALVRVATLCRRRAISPLLRGLLCGAVTAAATSPAVMARLFSTWPDISITTMRAVTEFNLGMRFWEHGAPQAVAESHFSASTQLDPEYASTWLYWGYLLKDDGRLRDATEKLERAAHCDPQGVDIRLVLGETWLALKQPGKARKHLEAAVKLSPDDATAHQLLGRACYLLDDWPMAERHLVLAVEFDPEYIAARRLLAITYDRLGRSVESEREFAALLERLPADHPEATLIRRRLQRRPAAPQPPN